ncbi:TetR/AcrR family transcriptional regulator [Kibdelosporangium aridum]|uniref:TetR/AcrR family transcriptional regulator n=1 Tax=Kibdelosporangium aridum TaxID=2030 RepID=A0A428ZC78_KIBAR|nr:TetR/AcrR family transcriptional regulator [Kibdelosporangium aridum]RSM85687.1 TetR/AcrR family transcriptional regulator [Kibdelosporangium aridum]
MAPPPTNARERILDAATKLFDRYGVHAVGMQRIIDEAKCGKHLLYREFESKDALVTAYLRRCERNWVQTLKATLASGVPPEEQLVELVRLVGDNVPGTRGCPIRNTFREFPDERHPAHQAAFDHFAVVREQVCELASRTTAADPERLADRILLIVNGLFNSGSVLSPEENAAVAVQLVRDVVLIETTMSHRVP